MSERSKLEQTEYMTRHHWLGKMIYWELHKKLKFYNTSKWYMRNPTSLLETHILFRDLEIKMSHPISRTSRIVKFAVPIDHQRVKLKECEKEDEYRDFAMELKKLWNMKVTIIPIAVGALDTVTKGLLQGLEDLEIKGRVETIKTTALLRSVRILKRVLETWGDLLSLKLQWETIS